MDEENFVFLSGLQKTYSGSVRAHVLKQHIRSRKARALRRSKQRQQLYALQASSHCSGTPSNSATNSHAQGRHMATRDLTHHPEVLENVNTSLVRSMSAARTDPFKVLAKKPTSREDFLLDFYVGDLVNFFGMSKSATFHPCRDGCFQVSITSEASFYALCSFAARHVAMRTGGSQGEALLYRVAAIRSINEAIQDPLKRYDDSTIAAIIGTIAFDQEARAQSHDCAQQSDTVIQLQGLQKIIMARGGFKALATSSGVSWMLHWYDLLNSGKLSAATTPLSPHAFFPPARIHTSDPEHRSFDAVFANDLATKAEEVVGIYGSFYREALERGIKYGFTSRDGPPLAHPAVNQCLRRGTLIWNILDEPDNLHRSRKIVALIYLNLSLWHYRNSPGLMWNHFAKCVCSVMLPSRSDSGRLISMLPAILMMDPQTGQIDDRERVWTTARFLFVYEKLSEELQLRLETVLMQFLMAGGEGQCEYSFTPESFRTEVMHDLGLLP